MTRQSDIYRRIKINTRRTVKGDGEVIEDAQVCCPNGDEMISMDRCATCGQCDGLVFTGEAGRSFIICRQIPTPREVAATKRAAPEAVEDRDRRRVGEIMTRDVLCVRRDLAVETLADLLLARGFGGAPVVDDDGHPIGMISKTDLVREGARSDEREVGDIMVPIALTLPESASIYEAAAVMACRRIHRLPVVSADGRVVGILSSLDLLRWIACENGYLIPLPIGNVRRGSVPNP